MKLSIIVPVFNEEKTIDTVIKKLKSLHIEGITKEIIIVNDGSTDETEHVLKKYNHDAELKILHHPNNIGKTSALKYGIEEATGDILIIQDADLEYNPDEIPYLVTPVLEQKAPVVYGSRFKGSIKKMKLVNRIANRISNLTFNLLYPVKLTDINTCYKVFKKNTLEGINIESQQFTFETEITAKLVNQGRHILELPINYVARSNSDGKKINWSRALQMYWGIFKYKSSK